MRPSLFTITCTTCSVRLAVYGEEAIGAILECPKCGCMVRVTPPEGWQPPPKPAQQPSAPVGATTGMASEGESDPGENTASGNTAQAGVNTIFARLWHSWYAIAAMPAIASVILVAAWLMLSTKNVKNNSSPPTAAQPDSNAVKAAVDSDRKGADSQIADKKSPDAKPKQELKQQESKSPDEKPANVNTPQAIVSADKTPDANKPAVNASDTKTAGDENKQPLETTAAQNKESGLSSSKTCKLVKLVAPEKTDLQYRLGEAIPSVDFRDMPFGQAIGLTAALSGLDITIDPDAMLLMQVSLRDPVTVRLTGATVEEILQQVAAQRGMDLVVEDGRIQVTCPVEQVEKLRRVRYTVSDLTGGDKAAMEQLSALVQKMIAPESWKIHGDEGTIETNTTALLVTQNGAVHEQILEFCEKLRNARGKPFKSSRDPKQFELTTRLDQAAGALSRKIDANFHEPATLLEILAYLGRQAEVDILLDRQALALAGMSDKSEISFVADNQPMATALNELLAPLKLGFRPIDAHTLQVSTQSSLDTRKELEFYPVGKLIGQSNTGSDLIERIKSTIFPPLWNKAGSSTAIYFDQPSATLIVLQSPPVHEAIRAFLKKDDGK